MTAHQRIMTEAGYASAQAVANAIGRSLSTVHRWANSGKVDSARSDRRLYISIDSVSEVFTDNEVVLQRLEALRAA